MKDKLILEVASEERISDICDLVNVAYRGDSGWTKETDLVSGDRSSVEDIHKYLLDPNAHLLVAIKGNEILSCVCIEKNGDHAYIGLFAVHPDLQGKGVGKEILYQAEKYASKILQARKYVMVVVSQRNELISYYERRGYARTGRIQDYPVHLNVGVPVKSGLTIEYLEKSA